MSETSNSRVDPYNYDEVTGEWYNYYVGGWNNSTGGWDIPPQAVGPGSITGIGAGTTANSIIRPGTRSDLNDPIVQESFTLDKAIFININSPGTANYRIVFDYVDEDNYWFAEFYYQVTLLQTNPPPAFDYYEYRGSTKIGERVGGSETIHTEDHYSVYQPWTSGPGFNERGMVRYLENDYGEKTLYVSMQGANHRCRRDPLDNSGRGSYDTIYGWGHIEWVKDSIDNPGWGIGFGDTVPTETSSDWWYDDTPEDETWNPGYHEHNAYPTISEFGILAAGWTCEKTYSVPISPSTNWTEESGASFSYGSSSVSGTGTTVHNAGVNLPDSDTTQNYYTLSCKIDPQGVDGAFADVIINYVDSDNYLYFRVTFNRTHDATPDPPGYQGEVVVEFYEVVNGVHSARGLQQQWYHDWTQNCNQLTSANAVTFYNDSSQGLAERTFYFLFNQIADGTCYDGAVAVWIDTQYDDWLACDLLKQNRLLREPGYGGATSYYSTAYTATTNDSFGGNQAHKIGFSAAPSGIDFTEIEVKKYPMHCFCGQTYCHWYWDDWFYPGTGWRDEALAGWEEIIEVSGSWDWQTYGQPATTSEGVWLINKTRPPNGTRNYMMRINIPGLTNQTAGSGYTNTWPLDQFSRIVINWEDKDNYMFAEWGRTTDAGANSVYRMRLGVRSGGSDTILEEKSSGQPTTTSGQPYWFLSYDGSALATWFSDSVYSDNNQQYTLVADATAPGSGDRFGVGIYENPDAEEMAVNGSFGLTDPVICWYNDSPNNECPEDDVYEKPEMPSECPDFCDFNTTPRKWQVTISGVGTLDPPYNPPLGVQKCSDCSVINGTYIFEANSTCDWLSMDMGCDPDQHLYLYFENTGYPDYEKYLYVVIRDFVNNPGPGIIQWSGRYLLTTGEDSTVDCYSIFNSSTTIPQLSEASVSCDYASASVSVLAVETQLP